MSLKLFSFRVVNMRTKESTAFIGQGVTIKEALSDGLQVCREQFRPKNDGKARSPRGVAVRLRDRRFVKRTVENFEGDQPYDAGKEIFSE